LAAGASCTLSIGFDPTDSGSVNGSVVLKDNALNAASPNYTTQTIALQGTGSAASAIPTIKPLSPNSAKAGGAAFTLTITGTNFHSGAVAKWNRTELTTTYVSATKLTAAVPKGLIATEGKASVTVTTAAGTSAPATFTINK
jgi:hypothetical protein